MNDFNDINYDELVGFALREIDSEKIIWKTNCPIFYRTVLKNYTRDKFIVPVIPISSKRKAYK